MKGKLSGLHPSSFRLHPYLIVAHPALEYRVADDVYAAAHVELAHGVGLVRLDGLDAQVEARGYLLVAEAPRYQAQDFRLALAQIALRSRASARDLSHVVAYHFARDGRV